MLSLKWRLATAGALMVPGWGSVSRPGRAEPGKVCDSFNWGCPEDNSPNCGDEGCENPPRPWLPTTVSCEQVKAVQYGQCVTGDGVCSMGQVECATVQGYGGGVCQNGSCNLMYPVGDAVSFKTSGCVPAEPAPGGGS